MGITLVLAALIGLILFHFITRSLAKTIAVVKEFQGGKKDARIPPSSIPEVNGLASAFNNMADTIERNIEEIRTMDNLRRERWQRLARPPHAPGVHSRVCRDHPHEGRNAQR